MNLYYIQLRTNIKSLPQDNISNINIYMHLRNKPQKRESNSQAKAAESDALLVSYSQVLV